MVVHFPGKWFFSFSTRPDRFCSPTSPINTRSSSPEIKRSGRETKHLSPCEWSSSSTALYAFMIDTRGRFYILHALHTDDSPAREQNYLVASAGMCIIFGIHILYTECPHIIQLSLSACQFNSTTVDDADLKGLQRAHI